MSLISHKVIRFIFNIFFLVFILLPVFSNSQTWLWAKNAAGNGGEGLSVSTDADGNVFVTGYFGGPTITFGSTTLTNAGNANVFLVKYDANGNVLWARSAGGTGFDEACSVSTDAGGNVFVTGYFTSPTITFGSTTLTNVGGFCSGMACANVFLSKYDATGNVLWAKSAGGASDDRGFSVSADAGGNVFVTGCFQSPTIPFGFTTLTNAGAYDVFIAKYDANGNVLWAKSVGGANDDFGISLSTDAGGNTFITGWFDSPTITFGSTTLTNVGSRNIFLSKYDAAGNVLWAKSAGGTDSDYGWSVSADAGGNVFVTGYFTSPTITFGSTTLTNLGGLCFGIGCADVFLAKYNATGNVLWAKNAGGASDDRGYSVSADPWGNAFVTGSFTSVITFGSITLTDAGFVEPMFIVKYDATGNLLCASNLTGGGEDNNGVCADPFGNAYIGGDFYFLNLLIVGSDTLNNPTGAEDVFVAKYTCGCNLLASIQGDTSVCNGGNITFTASAIGGTSYLWSTGATGSSITVNPSATTTYMVIVSNGICTPDTVYKTLTVTVCQDDTFFAPNSFTPNGDGLNDVFLSQTGLAPDQYLLVIFDRWGNKVFESNDYKKGWNGKMKNSNTIAQEDVYVWTVKLSDFNHQQHDYFGRVILLK